MSRINFFLSNFRANAEAAPAPPSRASSSKGSRQASTVADLQFSEHEHSLRDLWAECDANLSSDKLFPFLEAFLAFPHEQFAIPGHPTEVVHRLGMALLAYIRITSLNTNEVWTAEQFLYIARKDLKIVKGASINAEIVTFSGAAVGKPPTPPSSPSSTQGGVGQPPSIQTSLLTVSNRRFLLLLHAVVKLSSWQHNRDLMTNLLGNVFYAVLFLLFPHLLAKLDEVIVGISDVQAGGLAEGGIVDELAFLLSLAMAITQLPAGTMEIDRNELLGGLAVSRLPPYKSSQLEAFGVDYLLRAVPTVADFAPLGSPTTSGVKPKISRAKSTAPSAYASAAKQRHLEDIYASWLPNLSTFLRKLYLLSKIAGDESKRTNSNSLRLDKLLQFVIILQCEVVHALSVLLFAYPSLLPSFQTCEGLNTVGAFVLCKDAKVMRSCSAEIYELIFYRSLLAILCHSVCLRNRDSAMAQGPGQGKSIVAESLSMLSNLSTLLSVLTDGLQSELAERHVDQPLLAECSVPVHLRTGMPASDLYPWQNVRKSCAMFATAVTGLGQGEEYCQPAAFTCAMQAYAKARMNFLPANREDVFTPSKSYIFAHLDSRASSKEARDGEPTATSEEDPLAALYRAPSMRYMEELFDVLYAFIWSPSALSSVVENNTFLEACLSSCLTAMSGHVRHLGEVGSILQVLLFMMRCLSAHPEQTQHCIERKAIWRTLLDESIGNTVFTKSMVVDKDDLTVYKVKIGHPPAISPADPAGTTVGAEEEEGKRASKGSRLLSFYRLLLIDTIFEGLWLSCSTSAMNLTASLQLAAPVPFDIQTGVPSPLTVSVNMLSEVSLLDDFIASNKSDLALVYAFRWLSSLCTLCNHMCIGTTPVLWEGILDRALDCLKSLEGSMRPESGMLGRRLLVWPAKAALVVFIARCLHSFPASAWIGTFLSPSPSPQAKGLQGRCNKHIILLQMIMDSHCRDYTVAIILRLFTACAAANKPIATSTTRREHTVTVYEALAHDILKHICNFIKSPDGSQSAGQALLGGLVTVLRTKAFRHDEDLIEISHIRRLFASYGQALSIHKQLLGWSHHRPVIVKDLVTSLAYALTNTTISDGFVELVKHTMTLFAALSAGSYHLQELLQILCKDKRRLHSIAPVLPAIAPALYPAPVTNTPCNDLVFVIRSGILFKQQFVLFIGLCMEMLCNGLPTDAVNYLRGTPIQGEHFFSNLEGSFIIRNTAALSLLFALSPHFSTQEQSYVFQSLIYLVQRARHALANITVVTKCRPSLIDMILEVFPHLGAESKQQATRLLQIVGQFAITVAELKRMIRCLLHEPALLVQALQGTIASACDPQFYFLFEGNEAGILLPAFETFPGQSAYSFSTWIQLAVDDLPGAGTGLRERIYMLFSCRQPNGAGMEIYISLTSDESATPPLRASLWMSVYSSSRPHLPLKKSLCNIPMEDQSEYGQSWTYIGIAHSKGKYLSHSQVVAVVNSSVYRVELGFPRFENGGKFAAIGRVHPQLDAHPSAAAAWLSLQGRLATVYVFAEALPEAVLLQIFYQGVLRSAELSETMEDSMGVDGMGVGCFKKAIVLEYNPSVTTTDLVIDTLEVGPWGAQESFDSHMGAGKMHGRLVPGTHIFSSLAMKNALDCLGGSKVLFPLLYNIEKGQFMTILSMIQNSLQTEESKQFMIQHGFAFITLFLESIDPQSITVDMVIELVKFVRVDEIEWSMECIRKLFCNFPLWVLTPFLTQEYLLRFLSTHIDLVPVGVQGLCHALYFQYSEQQGSRMSQSGRIDSTWVAKWNSAYSLTSDELRLLRGYILQVIYQLMTSKPDLIKEVGSIIGYVIQESQAGYKVDGLQLLVKLLSADKPDLARRLVDGYVSCKGLLVLASLCSHVRAKVRLYAWLVLTNVITVTLNCGITSTTLDPNSVSRKSARRRSVTSGMVEEPPQSQGNIYTKLGIDESTLSAWLLHLVKLTLRTMQGTVDADSMDLQVKVLIYMLHLTMYGQVSKFLLPVIEQVPLDKTVTPASPMEHGCDGEYDEIFSSLHLLSIPMVFPSLTELIKFAPIGGAQRITHFQRISDALGGIENMDIFMSIPKWQSLLLDILAAERKADDRVDDHGLQVLAAAVGNIMTKCHVHSVLCGDLRSPMYAINPPKRLQAVKYAEIATVDLFEMMRRDQRILGCGGIRKTIAVIRAYISAGSLGWDRQSFDILTMIIEGLRAATRQLQESPLQDLDKDMRTRLLDINTWLTVEGVGEFIAMPPISMTRARSSLSLADRMRAETKENLGSYMDSLPQVPEPEAIPIAMPVGLTVDSDSEDDMDDIIVDHFARPRPTETTYEPQPVGCDEDIYNFEPAFDSTIWGTVASMIDLLGLTGNMLSTWFSQGDKMKRLEAGMRVGFVRGRYVVKTLRESADSIMDGATGVSGRYSHKNLMNRIVDQSIWLLLRIMLNYALQGAGQPEGLSVDSVAVQALLKLSIVLIWAKNFTRASYDEESLFVLAKLTLALQTGQGIDNGIWSQLTLKIIDEIMLTQARTLSLALSAHREPGQGSFLSHSSFSLPLPPPSPTPLEEAVTRNSFTGRYSGSDTSFSGYLLQRIETALGISVAWADWVTLMESYLKSAAEREKSLLSSKFDDLGLHKQSKEVAGQLEVHRRAVDDAITFYGSGMDNALQRMQANEIKALKDYMRSEMQYKKAVEEDWQDMFNSLANERGPWGSGALGDEQKLWMVHPCEDNLRMKTKLVSHEAGLGYLHAFLARGSVSEEYEVSTEELEKEELLPVSLPTPLQSPNATARTASVEADVVQEADDDDEDHSPAKQSLRMANSELGLNLATILKDLHRYRADSTTPSGHSSGGLGLHDGDSDEDFEDEPEDGEDGTKGPEAPAATGTGSISAATGEKILFCAPAEVILPSSNSVNPPATGMLEVTRSTIRFIRASDRDSTLRRPEAIACDSLWACASFPSTTWATADIVNILQRYYQLRFVAVELFTANRKVYFINLFQSNVASHLQLVLRKMVKPPHMQPFLAKRPMRIIEKASLNGQSLTAAWANREISNFEYLMRLNTIAGRTYNDLGQYPIFPWVLADYSSDVLNLRDRRSFRDLRWPVGAQDPNQRAMLISKFNDLKMLYSPDDDTSLAPFHYGTHYSVAGFVLWFLMRLEPYTSLHVQLQDGRIDRADRLLNSIEAAWRGCTSNPSDVKELIPEMFYCPELLLNMNAVDMGRTQSGQPIGDIVLPPWAKNPHDFMRQHRDALESEYVSKHLHQWIDLIFGVKARPPHLAGGSNGAVEACNVFFHLTYEGAVDLDKLRESNPLLYGQYVCQISEFGQSPAQLFSKEHIPRCPLSKVDFIWPIASIVRGVHTLYEAEDPIGMPRRMLAFKEIQASSSPLLAILEDDDRIITVDAQRIVGCHAWTANSPDAVPPCKLRVDNAAYDLSRYGSNYGHGIQSIASRFSVKNNGRATAPKRLGVPFAPRLTDRTFARIMPTIAAPSMATAANTSHAYVYRPVKVRSYEKDEKRERKRQLEAAANAAGTNTTASHNHSSPSGLSLSSLSVSLPISLNDGGSTPTTPRADRFNAQGNRQRSISGNDEEVLGLAEADGAELMDEGTSSKSMMSPLPSIALPSATPVSTPNPAAPATPSSSSASASHRIASPAHAHAYAPPVMEEHISARNFVYLADWKLLLSCGHWDRSIRMTSMDGIGGAYHGTSSSAHKSKSMGMANSGAANSLTLRAHRDVVTCLATAKDHGKRWLASGSRDCTVILWEMTASASVEAAVAHTQGLGISISPIRTLYGHDDSINTVLLVPEIDAVISAAEDGTIILHGLREGDYVRTILHRLAHPSAGPGTLPVAVPLVKKRADSIRSVDSSRDLDDLLHHAAAGSAGGEQQSLQTAAAPPMKISWMGYSVEGYLVVYSAEPYHRLTTFSLNGALLCSRRLQENLHALLLSEDGKVLVTGGTACLVVFRWVHNLELANDGPRKGLECVLDGSTATDHQLQAPFPSPIRALHLSKQERHLLVGLETGQMRVLAHDPDYLRERLHFKLEELGIL